MLPTSLWLDLYETLLQVTLLAGLTRVESGDIFAKVKELSGKMERSAKV
jgi:hypothetical protein